MLIYGKNEQTSKSANPKSDQKTEKLLPETKQHTASKSIPPSNNQEMMNDVLLYMH